MTKIQAAKIRGAKATVEALETVNAPAANRESARRIVNRLYRQARTVRWIA